MEWFYISLGIFGALLIGGFILQRYLSARITSALFDGLTKAQDSLIKTAAQELSGQRQEIKNEMDQRRVAIEKTIEKIEKDLRQNDLSFQSVLQQIKTHKESTDELKDVTQGLKNVLTNNQLRGNFGEQVAEDLLKMAGFVKGLDFEHNKSQESSSSRPDFAIFLPDRTKIHIDVKFPYANLQKASEASDLSTKEQFYRAFAKDVREKIGQITSKDYINPDDKTVDFVILFVPNEMIFSYIYEKLHDVWKDGMEKKVILAGPFSFTAILRMVRQAYDNFRYHKDIHEIVGHIKQFEKQFELYSEEFEKMGKQLGVVSETYRRIESTRTNQLLRTVDKIKIEAPAPKKSLIAPEAIT